MPRLSAAAALFFAIALAGCSVPGPGATPGEVHDPYEEANRAVHAFNKGVDRAVLRGAGEVYDTVLPDPVKQGVRNFSDNLSIPGTVVNQILQGRFGRAGRNTLRFTTNTLTGFGGLVDVAQTFELTKDETDFGETLHVWGVREGAYVELPFFGPSTERDAVGRLVDFALDPLDTALSQSEQRTRTGLRVVDIVGARGARGDAIDGLLYGSADSYSQLRLIYLQNRRFDLDMPPPARSGPGDDPFALDTEGF